MPSPKKPEPTAVAPEAMPAPQSLEDMLREPSLDDLMKVGARLAELTRAASIALSQFHFTQSRVDHGATGACKRWDSRISSRGTVRRSSTGACSRNVERLP